LKTNRLWLLILATSMFFPNQLLSQSTTPLFQIMTSNSILDRPANFRKIETVFQKNQSEPGFHLDEGFTDKIVNLKLDFINSIKAPQLQYDSLSISTKHNLIVKFENNTFSLPFEQDSTRILLVTLRDNLVSIIDKELGQILSDKLTLLFAISNLEAEQAVLLNALLNNIGYIKLEEDKEDIKDADGLAKAISKHLADHIKKYLSNNFNTILKKYDINEDNMDVIVEDLRLLINTELTEAVGLLRSNMIGALNYAEDEINGVIQSISDILIDSNIGFGLSNATGSATPGIILTYQAPERFRAGVFAGGTLMTEPLELGGEPSDSNVDGTDVETESELLVGLRFQGAYKVCALDVIGSIDLKKTSDKQIEAGLGTSFAIENRIFGAAYYWHWERGELTPIFSVCGLTYKSKSSDSESILLGMARNYKTNKFFPVIQFGYSLTKHRG